MHETYKDVFLHSRLKYGICISDIKCFNQSFMLNFFACSTHRIGKKKINGNTRPMSYRTHGRGVKVQARAHSVDRRVNVALSGAIDRHMRH